MRYVAVLVALYAAAVIQLPLQGWPSAPNLVLLVAAWAMRTLDGRPALLAVAVAGLLDDCLAGGPLGPAAATTTAAAFILDRMFPARPREASLRIALVHALFALSAALPAAALRLHFAGVSSDVLSVSGHVAARAATSAVLVIALTVTCRAVLGGKGTPQFGARRSARLDF